MRLETFCALGLAMFMATPPALAQESIKQEHEPLTGERVTVRANGPNETLRGRLVSFDGTVLTMDVDTDRRDGPAATRRLTVPTARLREVVVVKRDPIWNGAMFGAAFVGLCAATWCNQGLDEPGTALDAILAAGMGALVFGGIDALWIERRTIYKSAAGGSNPGGRGARLSFSVRF